MGLYAIKGDSPVDANSITDSTVIIKRWLEQIRFPSGGLALVITAGDEATAQHFLPDVSRATCLLSNCSIRSVTDALNTLESPAKQPVAAGDPARLPFVGGTFDLIWSRFATHRFPDCFRFALECARMLKPGGMLLVEDITRPDDSRAGMFLDAFERLCDPSHRRTYAGYEWRGIFLDAGFAVVSDESIIQPARRLIPWAEAMKCPLEVITRLQIMLAQAPPTVAAWLRPQYAGTVDAVFHPHHIIIMGRKEG